MTTKKEETKKRKISEREREREREIGFYTVSFVVIGVR